MLAEKYKPEDFYRFGQEGLNQTQMGEFYQASNILICQVLKKRPELRNALERGRNNLPFGESEITLAETLGVETETSLEANDEAKNKIREAIERKIFFCADIADFAGIERRDCYVLLCEMVSAGELARYDGTSVSYGLPHAKEKVVEPADELPGTPIPFKGLSNREKVLKAVAEGNHLSRHICAATGLSIGEVLHEIETHDYEWQENGAEQILFTRRELAFRAYFVKENLPETGAKLLLENGGLKIAAPKGTGAPPEVWAQKQKELEEINKNPKPFIPPPILPAADEDENFEDFEEVEEKKEINEMQKGKSKYTPQIVEEWARMGLSIWELERTLGFPKNKIHALFSKNKDLKAAYRNAQKNAGIKPQIKGKMEYTIELFEEWGSQGLTHAAIGRLTGKSGNTIYMAMHSDPKRVQAYKRGLAMFESKSEAPKVPYSEIPVTPEEDEAFKEIENKIAFESEASGDYVGGSGKSLAKEVFKQIVEPVLQETEDETGEEIDEMIDKAFKNLRSEENGKTEIKVSCPPNCGHSEIEHEAFDRGYVASSLQVSDEITPYSNRHLSEVYRIGFSAGKAEMKEKAAQKSDPLNHTFLDHRPNAYENYPVNAGKHIVDGDILIPPEEIHVDPRFSNTLERISENGHSKEGIEKAKQKFYDSLPALPAVQVERFPRELYQEETAPPPQNVKTIELTNGRINIDFVGNIFKLTGAERDLLDTLIDVSTERPNPNIRTRRRHTQSVNPAALKIREGRKIDRGTYQQLINCLNGLRQNEAVKNNLEQFFVSLINPAALGVNEDDLWDSLLDFEGRTDTTAEEFLSPCGFEIVD